MKKSNLLMYTTDDGLTKIEATFVIFLKREN